MLARFTLGIEEEFQLVDAQTGELSPSVPLLLEKGAATFGEKIKSENLQSILELISEVLPNIAAAREYVYAMRGELARFVAQEGLALISAGTHPGASWRDQLVTENERYAELVDEYQDVMRSDLIFGLHVHVGVGDKELAIALMNQVRTWLPHLLALSTNSPFWSGRLSGLKSYRTVQWKRFPRSGIPYVFSSWTEFDHYVQDLVEMGCIDDGKRIWWDVRVHPFFDTLEFRICDMPMTLEDTLAITALCQALVAKLVQLYEREESVLVWKSRYIEENKWRAMRYGLDGEFVDFPSRGCLSMRNALRSLLDFVDDVVDELGSRREMNYIRALLDDPRGNGADRQIALYRECGNIQQVVRFLMQQTMQGVPFSASGNFPVSSSVIRKSAVW